MIIRGTLRASKIKRKMTHFLIESKCDVIDSGATIKKTYLASVCKPILNLSSGETSFTTKGFFVTMRWIRIIHMMVKPCL